MGNGIVLMHGIFRDRKIQQRRTRGQLREEFIQQNPPATAETIASTSTGGETTTKATTTQRTTQKQLLRELKFKHQLTFETKLESWDFTRFCLGTDGDIVLYGKSKEEMLPVPAIYVYGLNGRLKQTVSVPVCAHEEGCHDVQELIIDHKKTYAFSCSYPDCKEINLCYNDDYGKGDNTIISAYKAPEQGLAVPGPMCIADDTFVLAVHCVEGSRSACLYDSSDEKFNVIDRVPFEAEVAYYIHHVSHRDLGGIVTVSNWENGIICATSLRTNDHMWKVTGELDGLPIQPHGMCSDSNGRLFAADGSNSRVLVLDSSNGNHIQTVTLPAFGTLYEVGYYSNDNLLVIQHCAENQNKEQISLFALNSK